MLYLLLKPPGWTPLQATEALRQQLKLGAAEKLTYAGRLDPMAEGVMLVLGGEERFNKAQFCALDKVYEAKILLGFSSDTGDALGRVRLAERSDFSEVQLESAVLSLLGEHLWPVPDWSAVSVGGKTLVEHRRSGRELAAPLRKMRIDRVDGVELHVVQGEALWALLQTRIQAVQGNFRQAEALESWQAVLKREASFPCVHLRIACGSGTYIRSLAGVLGELLGTRALLWQLRRIQVGTWGITDCLRLEETDAKHR